MPDTSNDNNAVMDWLERLSAAQLWRLRERVCAALAEGMALRRGSGDARGGEGPGAEDVVAVTLFSAMATSLGLGVMELAALLPRAREDARDAVLWLLATELLDVMEPGNGNPVVRISRGRPVRARN